MPGGRPKSAVWKHFGGDEERATCLKCQGEIVNAKVEKLERYILKNCARWTAADRAAYLQRRQQTQQFNRPRTSIGAASYGAAGGEGEVVQVTQNDLNRLVSRTIFGDGCALRLVERPNFQDLCLAGRPGLSVPSRFLMTGRLLDEDFAREFAEFVAHLMLQPYVAVSVDGCKIVNHQKAVNFVLTGPNMKAKL